MNLIIIKIIVGIVGILPIDTYNSSSIIASNALRKSLPKDLESKCSNAKAFEILESKCNVCHRKRNKRRIFSKENMDSHANDIYKQVFVTGVSTVTLKGRKSDQLTKEYSLCS